MSEIIGRIPEWMIHQSFRYVLGRMTYVVQDWCEWACLNWSAIPENEKGIIIRELEEAFERDDMLRSSGWWKYWFPLGADCDRAQWERVRAKYKGGKLK